MIQGAGAILIRKDGFPLLQHRTADAPIYPDAWTYPGGTKEEGEAPIDCAKRELEEETGYKTEDLNFLLEQEYDHPKGRAKRYIFWAEYDGEQKIECFEGQEMVFVDPSTFDNYKFIPGQREIIELALEEYKKKAYKDN